jgi:hypothetical protein
MRKGDWKILLFHEEWLLGTGAKTNDNLSAIEIYNLKDDEGERIDLSNINISKRDELLGDLMKWIQQTKAPLPTAITETNKPVLVEGNKE